MTARTDLAERLRAAVRELELAVDTSAYWDGSNGTREDRESARAAVDELVDEVARDTEEEKPCSS